MNALGTLATPPNKSWKGEVQVGSDEKWYDNAIRLATKEEAEAYVSDLFMRWTLTTNKRVVESPDEVNYQWSIERGLVAAREGV